MSSRATRLFAVAGAAAAGAGVLIRRKRGRRAAGTGAGSEAAAALPGPIGATGRMQRSAALGMTASKMSGSWAVDRARRVFADAERKEELDAALQLRTAEAVAETLGNLKGALMKLGQMASFLDQGLP